VKNARGRTATIAAAVFLIAVLIAVPSAQAAVTASHVATPTNNTYLMYNHDSPNTFAISGTTTGGTTGDHVDLVCFAGDDHRTVATNVAVNSNGSFSAPGDAHSANSYRLCNLKAVPAGTTPVDLSPFTGPRLLVGQKETYHVSGGLNNKKLYDYYLYFQQRAGGLDYDSLGSCGIDDGYLLDAGDSLSTVTWWCNAYLNKREASPGTRSEVRVDGKDAYTPNGANDINPAATSGFPALASYFFHLNSHTGNAAIHEMDPIVKCPNATYPPTAVTCPKFVSTGITDTRTITQDHTGRVAWVTDVFKNSDGKAHSLDLLWQNFQRFYNGNSGDSTQLEYRFPGHSGYLMHVLNDSVTLPASNPGTIFVRMHGAADGDTLTGRGAIVYDRRADKATFSYVSSNDEGFTLHQTAKVPAHGSVRFRFAYVDDFHAAKVSSFAHEAATIYKGCTVPNVTGKSLAAAKSAIRHANCAVGKISHETSATVSAGHVISSKPKAKTHVDYHAKVALVVNTG
jgi:hypothetical protein